MAECIETYYFQRHIWSFCRYERCSFSFEFDTQLRIISHLSFLTARRYRDSYNTLTDVTTKVWFIEVVWDVINSNKNFLDTLSRFDNIHSQADQLNLQLDRKICCDRTIGRENKKIFFERLIYAAGRIRCTHGPEVNHPCTGL